MRKRPLIIDYILLICLFIAFFIVSLARHENNPAISSDVKGYYMYLPAVFIDGSIHNIQDSNFVGHIINKKGETYTKFTCGVAYCNLPFFLAAHAYAHIFHYNADGLSAPYQYGIIAAAICWAFMGLFLLKRLLLKYFNRSVTWLVILCIALGTNFYCYTTLMVGMSHTYSLALFAATLLLTDSYYKMPARWKAILIAILVSWIILIRPTNIAVIIFLCLFKVVTASDLKERIRFFRGRLPDLFISIPFFIAVIFPQLLYWKEMCGQWIKYSYGDEHFIYWANPKIAAVLFDTQNGWLLYSPILLFLFWSLIMARKDPRTNFWGTTLVLIVITYLFASWDVWGFGGAFGHRCYIEYYPFLAFPLAVTMERITKVKSIYIKIPVFIVIFLFCYYSVGLATIFFTDGIWEGPEWRWNYDKWWCLVRIIFFLDAKIFR